MRLYRPFRQRGDISGTFRSVQTSRPRNDFGVGCSGNRAAAEVVARPGGSPTRHLERTARAAFRRALEAAALSAGSGEPETSRSHDHYRTPFNYSQWEPIALACSAAATATPGQAHGQTEVLGGWSEHKR